MTRIAQREPMDRRRSWALAYLVCIFGLSFALPDALGESPLERQARLMSTFTPAALPIRQIIRDAQSRSRHSPRRTLVAYYANYDKINEHNNSLCGR